MGHMIVEVYESERSSSLSSGGSGSPATILIWGGLLQTWGQPFPEMGRTLQAARSFDEAAVEVLRDGLGPEDLFLSPVLTPLGQRAKGLPRTSRPSRITWKPCPICTQIPAPRPSNDRQESLNNNPWALSK